MGEKFVRAPLLESEIRNFPMLRPFSKREKAELRQRYKSNLARSGERGRPASPGSHPANQSASQSKIENRKSNIPQ
jgi:hypothetical protein